MRTTTGPAKASSKPPRIARGDRARAITSNERQEQKRGGDLECETERDQEPGRPPASTSAAVASMPIPAGQAQHDGAHHGGVGLEGAPVADRERKDGERGHGQQGHDRVLRAARQHEKPEGRQRLSPGPRDSACFLQAQAGHSLQDDDARLVNRRLDQEVIRKRGGVELRPQEPRSAIEVACHHRRRNLPAHIILDDRLAGMNGPDQKCHQQEQKQPELNSESAYHRRSCRITRAFGADYKTRCFQTITVAEKMICIAGKIMSR